MSREDISVEPMVREDGSYPVVPLRKPNIAIGIVQTRVRGVDGDNPGPDMKENMQYLLDSIDRAQASGPCVLLCIHEFPVQDFGHYSRAQHLRVAVDAPGPGLEESGKKGKKYNRNISMGTTLKTK